MYGRSRIVLIGAVLVVAGSVAAVVVLAFGGTSQAAPTRAEYFSRVAAICRFYGPQLDRVAPPGDIATPAEVAAPIQLALPIVIAELREVRALRAPAELTGKVAHWLELRDQAVETMKRTLRAALLPDIRQMGPEWLHFMELTREAGRVGTRIGFPKICSHG